ncbi:twitching motility protein PilT [Aureimonas ureilytica]|uniref:Ribonuclease VapC n=1 Tax=Aureimonas ureilytica TaxID=401562 RepID=A0A175RBV4_9HYPH|nr:type II toxin-antitoxin system VapC family toxin [Aureimonas ureilytica]KTQ96323.1 twitching motility protein PilT [Aureimonas ureilytica]
MIVVDTSALMAILLGEPQADACMDLLEATKTLIISTGTMAEALIVADRRGVGAEMRRLLDGLGFESETVSPAGAGRIADAYGRWGKGIHPAGLNFGDCFAYSLAQQYDVPLLFVGEDFTHTDVRSALSSIS